jgi:hypothetical protein
VLDVPPGVYNFNHAGCWGFLLGISNLTIYGHGAVFQNTYDPTLASPNFGLEQARGFAAYPDRLNSHGDVIYPTTVDSSTFTLKVAIESSAYSVGD